MKLLIVGAGAQAKLALEVFRLTGKHEVVGLIDLSADGKLVGQIIMGSPVIGGLAVLDDLGGLLVGGALVACSSNNQKADLSRKVAVLGLSAVTAIHPSAVISDNASVGEGSLVQPLAVIQPFASVGRGVVIQTGTLVSHDCIVEDYANIGPSATLAGHVHIGEGAYVYSGAIVTPSVNVGAYAKIGAGAVVVRDVPPGATVMSVPGRVVAVNETLED